MSTAASRPRQRQPLPQTNSFDQLLTDLLQVVAEILLLRRPRVQTASVMPEPPPDLLADVTPETCPYCPGGSAAKRPGRLVR